MDDFSDETPTVIQAYETLNETARKWREELRREKLLGYGIPENQEVSSR